MKISILLIFISAFNLLAKPGYSQSEKISLKLTNLNTIGNVILEIERTTDYVFIYNEDVISTLNNEVNVEVTNQSLDEILNLLLEGTDLAYSLSSKQVTLYKDESKKTEANSSTIERLSVQQQTKKNTTGTVVDEQGEPIIGANIIEKGTTNGTITDINGDFILNVDDNAVLRISYIGYLEQEVATQGRSSFNIILQEDTKTLDELVVIGYGMQKKSDITGTVASLSKERLEMVPNVNVAQALQGAIPGIMIRSSSGGASPSEAIMVRGRNSITADNTPLIVLDGVPYAGSINDLSPNDVESIEVLKDASSAAIYGSRGSNGVILITTKSGLEGAPRISYDGKFSLQSYVKLPNLMDGEQFYKTKMERTPDEMTNSERAVYESGNWVDWLDLALRQGFSHQHNLSISGGSKNSKYFISGNLLDVKGLLVNDDYMRLGTMINVDIDFNDWLTLGTRTQISYMDRSGAKPSIAELYFTNPLATPYDDEGNLTILPVADDPIGGNPLESTLYKDVNTSHQILSNNYLDIKVPFIHGLNYRLNTGIRASFKDRGRYQGSDTKTGLDQKGIANTNRDKFTNLVVENILSYSKELENHNLFFTGVYSYEENNYTDNAISAQSFPNDFLGWYGSPLAEIIQPRYSYAKDALISQMLRLNYSYDSKYLFTATVRRDGFSGFGSENRWGVFPSVAFGWNINNEQFFPWKNLFDELKLRLSYGQNGNQAVGAYRTISRLQNYPTVQLKETIPGYIPSALGTNNLGWETSKTFNLGVDFTMLQNRVTGTINLYNTHTTDLLLNRTISPVHGITSITENIGETKNKGLEFNLTTRNIVRGDFRWSTSGNITFVKNKIVSLYGYRDDQGVELDDISNKWFIGKPISVNYDYVFDGIWQLDESDEAAKFGTRPGFVRLKDANGDGKLSADDREIIGQNDPKLLWGFTNTLSYKNFTLDIFIHGVHGVTTENPFKTDHVTAAFRRNTYYKDYWTPNNPSNTVHANHDEARRMGGVIAPYYDDASFIRIKDISFSYNFPSEIINGIGIENLRAFINGRNLFTFTNWSGLDPEFTNSITTPLQKEFVFGLQVQF